MKSTIYSPNEQAFRNIDAELCRSYIRLQCIIRHAAIPGDPWTNTMDNDVPVLPAVVAGVPRIAGRDDR